MIKNNKNSDILFIGIPIVVLLFSMLFLYNPKEIVVNDKYNKYFKKMPDKYIKALDSSKKNDSTYFSSIIENYANRELVIFMLFPDHMESASDFNVKLKSINNTLLELKLTNNSTRYNYNKKTYGVFKTALPFIDIDKIFIERTLLNKRQQLWNDTINKPFNDCDEQFIYQQINNKTSKKLPNVYLRLFTETLLKKGISFLPFSYTINKDSLFQVNTTLDTYISKNDKTIGTVNKPKEFWKAINTNNQILQKKIIFNGKNTKDASKLIEMYSNNQAELHEVFDIKKLASFKALSNLFSITCKSEIHFIYNKDSNLLEPFFTTSKCLGDRKQYIVKPLIKNINYIKSYINELNSVANLDYYNSFIKTNKSYEKEISFINKYYPKNIFDLDIIDINKKVIAKSLNVDGLLKSEVISINDNQLKVSVLNFSSYPIIVKNLNHKKNKKITKLNPEVEILSGKKDTLLIDLPRSFENLFVSKKKKVTGFVLFKHIHEIYLEFSVVGLNQNFHSGIIPYQEREKIEEDLFRTEIAINSHKNILVNEIDKTISFTKKTITITSPLVIPNGYTFVLKPSTTIDILQGGKIISHAPLSFIGTKLNPIKISSSDKKGQGLIVFSEGEKSNLEYVIFDNLTNLQHGYWNVSGAVTFYESPVNLNYVTVSNNTCEDALNIVRTTFSMKNCTISNTQSDAFDGDFVTGTIDASNFTTLGNDAIDISGSDIIIKNVQISNAGDKGLSAGENSKMIIDNITISNSEIAVAGKDLSSITINNIKIKNTKLAFTAFQKKPEFGPSNITVKKVSFDNVETNYLIENTSSLKVDGEKVKSAKNVKDRMYGVEFGVSSKSTKNKKQ